MNIYLSLFPSFDIYSHLTQKNDSPTLFSLLKNVFFKFNTIMLGFPFIQLHCVKLI